MAKLTRLLPGALLVLTVLGCHAEGHRHTLTIQREWPAAEVQRVELQGTNGRIHVVGADNGKVVLNAQIKVRGRREEDPAKVVTISVENGTLRIIEKHSGDRNFFMVPFLSRDYASVNYDLTVPASVDLALRNVNGGMKIAGCGGKMDLNSVNGGIDVRTPAGDVNARTVNGRISADFEREFRGAHVKTVNGSIDIGLPQAASFNLEISQVNGSFRSNIPLPVNAGGRDIAATVNGGNFPLELSTVNGSVHIDQKQVEQHAETK